MIGGTDRTGQDSVPGAGDDTLWGDGGNDVFSTAARGNDAVIGGDGNDRLTGAATATTSSTAPPETIRYGAAQAPICSSAWRGATHIEAGDGADEVFGGLGNDQIFGGAGNDELLGNEGNDWMKGGQGDDHLTGDNGNPFGEPLPDTDTALFSGKAKNYTITHNADGSITVTDNVGAEGTDTLQNIERLRFADKMVLADGSAEATGGDGGYSFCVQP